MKREIKFRAWSKHKKKMYGSFHPLLVTAEAQLFMLNENAVIMEYTCLKDKNVKEMYEGDVVKWFDELGENPNLFKIEYAEAQWILSPLSERINGWYLGEKELEVVGNVYENKDLLPSE